MKKHGYTRLLMCGLLIGLAAASANAQSTIKVNVPFDFTIGTNLLEAGEYTVQPASAAVGSEVLALRDAAGNSRFVMMGIRREPNSKDKQPKLVFHRYGDLYFLSQVWLSAGEAGVEIRPGSHERELLASQSTVAEGVTIVAQKR
jgi:hypothetical protein